MSQEEYEKLFTKFYSDFFKFKSGKKSQLRCPGCQSEKRFIIDDDKIVYSRLYGTDKNNYWKASKDLAPNYFYAPDYDICIFNGWRRKTKWKTNEYALDDEGYDGFEHYWN